DAARFVAEQVGDPQFRRDVKGLSRDIAIRDAEKLLRGRVHSFSSQRQYQRITEDGWRVYRPSVLPTTAHAMNEKVASDTEDAGSAPRRPDSLPARSQLATIPRWSIAGVGAWPWAGTGRSGGRDRLFVGIGGGQHPIEHLYPIGESHCGGVFAAVE